MNPAFLAKLTIEVTFTNRFVECLYWGMVVDWAPVDNSTQGAAVGACGLRLAARSVGVQGVHGLHAEFLAAAGTLADSLGPRAWKHGLKEDSAVLRTVWTGWCIACRFGASSFCFFCGLDNGSSVEHACVCPTFARTGAAFLRFAYCREKSKFASSLLFYRPSELTDERLLLGALHMAAAYRIHCHLRRHSSALRGEDAVRRALEQVAKELVQGLSAAMSMMDDGCSLVLWTGDRGHFRAVRWSCVAATTGGWMARPSFGTARDVARPPGVVMTGQQEQWALKGCPGRFWEDKPNAGFSGTPLWRLHAERDALQQEAAKSSSSASAMPDGLTKCAGEVGWHWSEKRQ
ncbi:unnamed protein product, partial [Prorocentrum cordatum]